MEDQKRICECGHIKNCHINGEGICVFAKLQAAHRYKDPECPCKNFSEKEIEDMVVDAKLRKELASAVMTASRCVLHGRIRPCLVCAGCEACGERIADSIIKALKDSTSHKGRALRAIIAESVAKKPRID